MTDDPFDSQEWAEYAQRVRDELVPMIEGSPITMSMVPSDGPDVKMAVELGFCILMDKPILAIAQPGTKIPAKMRAVADEIVIGEPGEPAFNERLLAAIERMQKRVKRGK